MEIKKFESIKFVKFIMTELNNNSFINLDDGSLIRIFWSCSNAVKTHNFLYISLKKLATGRPVAKTLIKYKINNLEENDEEEKEPINIEF